MSNVLEASLLTETVSQLTLAVRDASSFPCRVAMPLDVSEMTWLSQQAAPRGFWQARDQDCGVAFAGVASRFSELEPGPMMAALREVIAESDLLAFGGFSFDGTDAWPGFGQGHWLLPRFTFSNGELAVQILSEEDRDEALATLSEVSSGASPFGVLPPYTERSDVPSQDGWNESIRHTLDLLEREVLDKLVLARRVDLRFDAAVDPVQLLEQLRQNTHHCYYFLFEFEAGTAFLGATPERLFHRKERLLSSEVVAGTRSRGTDREHDKGLGTELLGSAKDQLEHDIVRKFIRQKLYRLCDRLRVDESARLLKLARKQHLYSTVQATLNAGVDDAELLTRLHPTPAVGGVPLDNAMSELSALEPFNRGWYAGPVGCLSRDEAEFAVAIRSGLLQDRRLSLYSGAGIVTGSNAEEEWAEIENKISDFIDLLG